MLSNLIAFLKKRTRCAMDSLMSRTKTSSNPSSNAAKANNSNPSKKMKNVSLATADGSDNDDKPGPTPCLLCSGMNSSKHATIKCPFIRDMKRCDRCHLFKLNGLCYGCGSGRHQTKDCEAKGLCPDSNCLFKVKHNPVFHNDGPPSGSSKSSDGNQSKDGKKSGKSGKSSKSGKKQPSATNQAKSDGKDGKKSSKKPNAPNAPAESDESETDSEEEVSCLTAATCDVLLNVMPVRCTAPSGKSIECLAIVDTAASFNSILPKLRKMLKLKGPRSNKRITQLNSQDKGREQEVIFPLYMEISVRRANKCRRELRIFKAHSQD